MQLPISFAYIENILQPSNHTLQPTTGGVQSDLFSSNNSTSTANPPVGSTWSNSGKISIDLDNLLSGKSKLSGPAPSMNQLKTQSPIKTSSATSSIPPPFQANLIGAPAATSSSSKPQYSNIPTINNHSLNASSSSNNSAGAQLPMFGNLVSLTSSSNQNNLNNQFNAFQ